MRRARIYKLLRVGLLLLALATFAGPLLAWLNGELVLLEDYSQASRESVGLAPDPQAVREAVVQLYAARLVDWRGAFAVHTWVAVKPRDAEHFTTYEVDDDPDIPDEEESFLLVQQRAPDQRWFGSRPVLLADIRGEPAERAIAGIQAAVQVYPHRELYRSWPGPNSNTFTAYLIRHAPGLRVDLPASAIGKDYPLTLLGYGATTTGTGLQFSLGGLLGLSLGREEGLELQLLGLGSGVDFDDLRLKLPGLVPPSVEGGAVEGESHAR
jgi:hypothetical protein